MSDPTPAPHSLGSSHPAMQPYPEWQIDAIYQLYDGIEALLVSHKHHKTQACWWVTTGDEGQLLTQNILELSSPWRDKLLAHISPYLQHLADTALSAIKPATPSVADEHSAHLMLAALPANVRLQLLSFWFQNEKSDTLILPPQALLNVEKQQKGTAFAPPYVRLLLQTRLADDYILAISPFSGQPVFSQLTLHCAEGTACRFVDENEQLVFYLFWPKTHQNNSPHTSTPIFYYPNGNFLLGESPLTPLIPLFLYSWVIVHPDFARQLHTTPNLRISNHSMGHTSNLWDSFSNSPAHQQEATGQTAPSFPFLNDIWNNNPPTPKP